MDGNIASEWTLTIGSLSLSSMFYFLLIAALVLWYTYWCISRRHLIKLAAKIPGPKGFPIIGNAYLFRGSANEIFETFHKITRSYVRAMKLWLGSVFVVLLTDPRDVEIILNSPVHIDKSPEYKLLKPWLGNGLLTSTGQQWRSHRKLIEPAFHLSVLKNFVKLFNVHSKATVEKLRKENGKEFDCHDYMSEATVETLLETAMGVNRKTQDKSSHEYVLAVMKMCNILHIRHFKIWLKSDWVFKFTKYAKIQNELLDTIHSLTRKVLKSKRETFSKEIRGSIAEEPSNFKINQPENVKDKTVAEEVLFGQSGNYMDDLDIDDDIGMKKRSAFLDLMIESSQNEVVITDEEIKEEVDTIMMAGHDTTAAGSSFFLCMMGVHPEIQDKVIQELDEIFGDSDRPATFGDIIEMKFLERCLLETLRLYPPVPIISRQIKEDVKLASGDYVIPGGSRVLIYTFGIHRRPDIFKNPEKFDPDNFLPECTVNRHYYGFIPFSAGPRSCVGRKYAILKLKVLLSTIMRNFRVKSDISEDKFKLQGDIILKRTDGFKIRLEPRKAKAPSC